MSELDDFIHVTVQPMLRAGESLVARGWMAPPVANWRQRQERYFAAATTQRLVVIQSTQGFMWGTPKPENHGITSHEYGAMTTAWTRSIGAMATNLGFEMADGTTTAYVVPSPSIVGANGVEGHFDFSNSYRTWLVRHVAAGELRTPQGMAAAAQEWWNRDALDAGNRTFIAAEKAREAAARSIRWPYVLAFVMLLVTGLGVIARKDVAERVGRQQAMIDMWEQRKRAGETRFGDQTVDEVIAQYRGYRAQASSHWPMAYGVLGVGLVGLVGFAYLGVTLNKRKRAKNAPPPAVAGAPPLAVKA